MSVRAFVSKTLIIMGIIAIVIGLLFGLLGVMSTMSFFNAPALTALSVGGFLILLALMLLPVAKFFAWLKRMCARLGKRRWAWILCLTGLALMGATSPFLAKIVIKVFAGRPKFWDYIWGAFNGWGTGGMTWLLLLGLAGSSAALICGGILFFKINKKTNKLQRIFSVTAFIVGVLAGLIFAIAAIAILVALIVFALGAALFFLFIGSGGSSYSGSRSGSGYSGYTPQNRSLGSGYIERDGVTDYLVVNGDRIQLREYNSYTGEATDYDGNTYKID